MGSSCNLFHHFTFFQFLALNLFLCNCLNLLHQDGWIGGGIACKVWWCMTLFFFFFSSFSNPAHVVHCGINSCGLQSFTVQMASKKKKEKNQIRKWRTSNMVWGKKCRARGFGSALTFSPQSQWPYLPAAQRLEPHQSQRLSFVSPHYPQFTLNYLPSWTAPLASFVAAPHNAKLLPVILKCSPLNCSLVTFHVVNRVLTFGFDETRSGSGAAALTRQMQMTWWCTASDGYGHDLLFYWGQRSPGGAHVGKLGGTCIRRRVSLIWVAPGGRVMASENRSGVRPFTSNVQGDYTLIEVV